MSTETKTMPKVVDVADEDIFVLVLMPHLPAFGVDKPLDIDMCGRSLLGWAEHVVEPFANKKVEISKSDDILTVVRNNMTEHKYTVVIYADTPLFTRDSIEQAIAFASTFEHSVCKMPRGWVFKTSSINEAELPEAAVVPNLDDDDFIVAYNYAQVALAATIMRGRINTAFLRKGVNIIDPLNAYISAEATIGKGTRIGPGVVIRGATKIGKNCRITNCVEIKNSQIGEGTKIAHMSYVGDATVGANCNIGCGVVFCNYDGREKNKITLGDNVFVGSNCNLVAPLTLADNSYIASGSTITQDVPKDSLGIARARQAIKENWRVEESDE